jgi:DNA processing protein
MKIIRVKSTSDSFPARLQQLHKAPEQLFIAGDTTLLDATNRPVLAVVGSRKITQYGKQVLHELLPAACRAGVIIVSGLAYGADILAHQIALDNNTPTIAVLPSPVDRIYPVAHAQIAERISQNGLLVSEYPSGTVTMNYHFIERNRIIAALADAILVPEAAEKSGSLHTVGFGLELGRTILSVPGNITNPLAIGTNNLLKHGATPVTNAKDVLDALGILEKHTHKSLAQNQEEQMILDALAQKVLDTEGLLRETSLSPQILNQHLTMLELRGAVKAVAGNWMLA